MSEDYLNDGGAQMRQTPHNPLLDDGTTREVVELTPKLRWRGRSETTTEPRVLQQMVKVQNINKRFQVVSEHAEWRDVPLEIE